jgi:DNA-binding NtrC family response regulator
MAYNILIIDSELNQRDMLTDAIENRLGYRAIAIASIQDAAHHFHTSHTLRPDLILLDWPASDARAIAGLKSLSAQAPLVVLVKYGDYDAAMMALGAGAQEFLMKPAATERIGTTFHNLLLLRDARREVEKLRRERMQNARFSHAPQEAGSYASPSFPLIGEDGNIRRMEEIEAESIRFAMQYYHGRMTEVARRLGIGRSTLYRKLSEISAGKQEEAA